MFRFLLWAILVALKPKALVVAENVCLRQQLLVLQRERPRPYLKTADRFFWVLASRWLGSWRNLLLIVKPETVLKWHQRGWRLYWSWRSQLRPRTGRPAIPQQLQVLIRRMAMENRLWGQKRIQAELARLGFKVSARTVAKYMRTARRDRGPSVRWRTFLKLHASNIWACDFFCVQTLLFETLHVFFVIQHINREVLHVAVTRHPTSEWLAQQFLESCAWDRRPPRFLIHDRDSRYGASFDRRLKRLGVTQVRTPFRCPTANAVAERWVKSARTECLDHLLVFNESTLRRAISSYVTYYNHHRPHRSIGQRAPCPSGRVASRPPGMQGSVIAEPVLGGLHHIYRHAS